MKNILVLNICQERLHGYEFVKPVEDVLRKGGVEFESFHYKQLDERILDRCSSMIICGTSLRDDGFVEDIDKFRWIFDNFEGKPVLGICAGSQIISLVFGGEIKSKTEIGYFDEKFEKDFLGLGGKQEVWHLHNNYSEFSEDFEKFTGDEIPQAVKHRSKEIYGVLFHPEVRNKKMILEFIEK
jgi:GMP synthase (glutamine-hydrolysing)